MEIKITYVTNGAIYCGFKPDNVEVLEERKVLYPSDGYELEHKITKEHFDSVWLKDDDVQENYNEVKIVENVGEIE